MEHPEHPEHPAPVIPVTPVEPVEPIATCRDVLSIDVGRKNLGLCVVQPGDDPTRDRIKHWAVIACEPSPAGIRDALAPLDWALQANEVVIERQPPRNATMSRLQHYLEMYFAMHAKDVVVQDAKHKLAFAASTPWWPAQPLDNWTYHTRKKVSVTTAQGFVNATTQDPAVVAGFLAAKKKDDYADSLLQCQAYIARRRGMADNPTPPATTTKAPKTSKTSAKRRKPAL